MVTAEGIRTLVPEKPFVPLRIYTILGQTYDITHPDLVLIGRTALHVGIASRRNPALFETVNRVAISGITEVKAIPIPPY